MRQTCATVVSNKEILPNTYLMWIEASHIATSTKPGQFLMIQCGQKNEFLLRRPLSIHRVSKKQIAVLFNVVGQGTKWLSTRCKKDKLNLLGPLGREFSIAPSSRSILLVGGGVGIAPLIFLAESAKNLGKSITLLLGASTGDVIYPYSLIPPGITYLPITEDGSLGEKGMVTDFILEHQCNSDQVFACGPINMYRSMAAQEELRIKAVQVSLEVRLGCGTGICYGCTIRTQHGLRQVCKDGPIFELQDVLWDELN
ncbi:MAG: dihydroorotate dehydrogenase electron transfer subunit [Chloroflexota bacterium]|nr:dihydroorotate dehydrogenase electron transfer subunit [Chloroflexota bacterium]